MNDPDPWWMKYAQIAFICLLLGTGISKCTGENKPCKGNCEPDRTMDLRP